MGRTPRIPPQLTKGPFSLEEARAAGLTHSALKGKAWRRIDVQLYSWAELQQDRGQLIRAWQRRLPAEAVFSGPTAAWLFDLDVDPISPVEIVLPPGSGLRSRAGLSVLRHEIPPNEAALVKGMRATALPRTLARLCMLGPPVEALGAIDMAIRLRLTDAAALCRYADGSNGHVGSGRLRALARLAAPAESPMETRLRWLLIQAGLPRPEVQTNLVDSGARFVGRADLYYPAARLVLEYDGGNHRERLVEDDRRQNRLINAGYRLLRFTAGDIHNHADVVVAQVRAALEPKSAHSGTHRPLPGPFCALG